MVYLQMYYAAYILCQLLSNKLRLHVSTTTYVYCPLLRTYTCTLVLIFSVAPRCDMDPPAIEMGNRTTLEPVDRDIVGGQANYSCNENCFLQGSSSLRCRRVVSGITPGPGE